MVSLLGARVGSVGTAVGLMVGLCACACKDAHAHVSLQSINLIRFHLINLIRINYQQKYTTAHIYAHMQACTHAICTYWQRGVSLKNPRQVWEKAHFDAMPKLVLGFVSRLALGS